MKLSITYDGMTEKAIIEETRLIRLHFWLKRQELNADFNRKMESASSFKRRLRAWVEDDNPHAIAPSFHLASL
jgi:hypothetical protein